MTTLTREDVEVIRTDVEMSKGPQWLVKVADQHYVVSAIDLDFGGIVVDGYRTSETMAFPADADGEVTDWGEVAFVPFKDHEACIADLLVRLNGGDE